MAAADSSKAGGRQFGAYRLVRRIAVGGMAEIYLAKARGVAGFEKYVALKTIHPNYSQDERFVEMLIEEAKITVQLQHENVAQVFDLGKVGDTYYIAMEYVEGADLYQLLRHLSLQDRDLPAEAAAFIGREICAALDYAHRRMDAQGRPLGIIHRDISPQNVLAGRGGEVKVADFGIAKASLRARQTAAGVIKGKYHYMSPEQAWGEAIDPRADLFSVGVVLYEMLIGQMLYLDDDIELLLEKVRTAAIPPVRERRPDVPAGLERIVMRAVARDPDRRWASAHQMMEALEQFLHGYAPDFGGPRLARLVRETLDAPATPASGALSSRSSRPYRPALVPSMSEPGPLFDDDPTELRAGAELFAGLPPADRLRTPLLVNLPDGLDAAEAHELLPPDDLMSRQEFLTGEHSVLSRIPVERSTEEPTLILAPVQGSLLTPPPAWATPVRSPAGTPEEGDPTAVDGPRARLKTPVDDLSETRPRRTGSDDAPTHPRGLGQGERSAPRPLAANARLPTDRALQPLFSLALGTPYHDDLPAVAPPGGTPSVRPRLLRKQVLAMAGLLTLGALAVLLWQAIAGTIQPDGRLLLNASVAGARVRVDGKDWPTPTPAQISGLSLGVPHALEVTAPGYEPWRDHVTLSRENPEVSVTAALRSATGEVMIQSEPNPADVLVNGRPVGRTPLTLERVPMDDDVTIEVRKAGYAGVQRTYRWSGRSLITADFPLQPMR